MKTENKHFKLNVPPELLADLKELAVSEGRSMTSQINLMLRQQLASKQCCGSTCAASVIQNEACSSMEKNRRMICTCSRKTQQELARGYDDG